MIEIYLPCTVFEVDVELTGAAASSQMNLLVLEAVDRGIDTVDSLQAMLRLGHLPILDMVYSLWREDKLYVDAAHGDRLRVSPYGLGLLRADSSERPVVRTEKLMADPLTHEILPLMGSPRMPPRDVRVPIEPVRAALLDLGQHRLIGPMHQQLRYQLNDTGFEIKHLAKAGSHSEHQVRYLKMLVSVWETEDAGLVLRILEPESLDARVRSRMQVRLAEHLRRAPRGPFVTRLRESAKSSSVDAGRTHPLFAVDRLSKEVDALDMSSFEAAERHERLSMVAQSALLALDACTRNEVELEILVDRQDHTRRICRMLEEPAIEQAVLVCPFLQHSDIVDDGVWDSMKSLVRRQRRVFLLWGISEISELGVEAGNALRTLAPQRVEDEPLVYSTVPSCTHAKLVIAGMDSAVVSSYNFLDSRDDHPGAQTPLELGVLMKNAAPLVGEILRWCRGQYPEYGPSMRMKVGEESSDDVSQLLVPEAPLQDCAAAIKEASEQLWRESWRHARADIQQRWQTRRGVARWVHDAEHSALLQGALATCRRRLIITSDRLSSDVVSTAFIGRIRSRLEEAGSLRVLLVYRRTPAGDARQTEPERLLDELSIASGGRLAIVRTNNHAKLLVADDLAVVSSHNFLSFTGEHSLGARRTRTEVGLGVRGKSADRIVRKYIAALELISGVSIDESIVRTDRTQDPADGAEAVPGWWWRLQGGLQALDDADEDGTSSLVQWFESIERAYGEDSVVDAARDLAKRLDSKRDQHHERIPLLDKVWLAAWAAQGGAGEVRGGPAFRAFMEGKWYEAYIMAMASEDAALPAWLAAAVLDGRSAGSDGACLEDAACRGNLTEEQRCVVALQAICSRLAFASMVAEEVLELLHEHLPACVQRLSLAARELVETTGAAMPRTALLQRHQQEVAVRRRGEVRSSLLEVLDRDAGLHFDFKLGTVLWRAAFSSDGVMSRLRAHVEDDDTRAGADWMRRQPGTDDAWLDALAEAAGGNGARVLHRRRPRFLRLLAEVRVLAEQWVGEPAETASVHERLGAAGVGRLASTWRSVTSDLEDLAQEHGLARPLVEDLTEYLEPLMLGAP